MHRRQRHPDDILHDLAELAAKWHRQGADIDDQDVLCTVRELVPDYQPYADLDHAIMRDRIHNAIAAMQKEIAGASYRDGCCDTGSLTRDGVVELIREVVAAELPDAIQAIEEGK
jgi:hypothetical protein